jgi:hypothetical protein
MYKTISSSRGQIEEIKYPNDQNWYGLIKPSDQNRRILFGLKDNTILDEIDWQNNLIEFDKVAHLHDENNVVALNITPILPEKVFDDFEKNDLFKSWIGLKLGKAGMNEVDLEKVNEIIFNLSKNSKFYAAEKIRYIRYKNKSYEIKSKIKNLSTDQRKINKDFFDSLIPENSVKHDRTVVHVDMDMFYCACEEKRNPKLRDKCFGVGTNLMLSTSNYIARRYGIRAGMPGYIGKVNIVRDSFLLLFCLDIYVEKRDL